MRKKIIILFLILLIFQAIQITAVDYSIRQLQLAVNQVKITVEGREISRSTSNLLDQYRDNVILIAGMNFPVTGLKKLRSSWRMFEQRQSSMIVIAEKLSFNPGQLSLLKKNITASIEKKKAFEATVLNNAPGETYTADIHNAAFELDESIESTKSILDVMVKTFVQKKQSAVEHEQKLHDLPSRFVSTIGLIIGCILLSTGYFAVTKIVNPLIDLTKKYQAAMKKLKKEQEITIVLEKARATAQAKSDFLANMSHELRTPMNAVLGFSQLLNDTELEGKQKNYLELIMSSGHHLVRIINDILDFSKLEAGKISLEQLDFNLEKLINEVTKIVATRMAENPLDMYVDYPDDLPRHIKSDPTRFKQILVNLLGNAIKFTSQGEVGIIVRVDEQIDHKENEIPLRISVKDSGIGIKKDKIEKIFESFTQADEATTRKYGGTGLGLTITKSIVEALGGRIWAESLEGKGSQFTFAINVAKSKSVDQIKIDQEAKKLLTGKTVFIIDDNLISRKIIRKTCESIKMEVLSTEDSGPSALARLDNYSQKNIFPDIILCDILMPGMYGYEVARKLRTDKKFDHTKIIAISKMPEADIAHYISDDCFNAYLTKPVSKTELIDVVAKELGHAKTGKKEPAKKKTVTDKNASDFEGIRILVAENNITNIMFLKECLEKLKCVVDFAYNGEEAIARIKSREYDLCLMDLHMPIKNGIEATKVIRKEINKTLPIIALTAAVLKEDQARAKEAGMNDFLKKPLNIQELKEKILQFGKPEKLQTKNKQWDLKALIVDDNSLNVKLLSVFLKKLNVEGAVAVNGQEAVNMAKADQYDICFMDIQMPVMGGVEATKIIREEISKDLPIIAITAVSEFTLEKSLEAGMNDYISKPVDLAVLKNIILKYCKKSA